MERFPKPVVISSALILIVSFAFALSQFSQKMKERQKRQEIERLLAQESLYRKDAESQIEILKTKLSTLESELNKIQAQMQSLLAQLDQERRAKDQIDVYISGKDKQIVVLKEEKEDILKELKRLKEEFSSQQQEVERLRQENDRLVKSTLDFKEKMSVELGKIVVRPRSQIQSHLKKAEVVRVNKEYNFVVLNNLGNKDGIQIGENFSVFREDKIVGEVAIEKIGENFAVARLLNTPDKGIQIEVGDYITLPGS